MGKLVACCDDGAKAEALVRNGNPLIFSAPRPAPSHLPFRWSEGEEMFP
jgi:hypothetical protein